MWKMISFKLPFLLSLPFLGNFHKPPIFYLCVRDAFLVANMLNQPEVAERLERKLLRKATLLSLGLSLFNWEVVMDLQAPVSKIH